MAVKKKAASRKGVAKKRVSSKKVAPRKKAGAQDAQVLGSSKPEPKPEPKTSFEPNEAKRLLQADLAKIVAKSKDPNKRLTAADRNMLVQFAQGVGAETLTDSSPPYAKSIAALCGVMGITRETFYDWRRKYPKDIPVNTTNGEYDVAAWRAFASARGLKGGEPDDEEDLETLEGLRKEDLRVKIDERNLKVSILKQDFIAREDVREAITGLVASTIKLLRDRFENELPPVCAGLDARRIQQENAAAIDEVCALLHDGGEQMGESSVEEES